MLLSAYFLAGVPPSLLRVVGKWLNGLFNSRIAEVYTERVLIALAVCFFLLIFWLVYRHHLSLFVRSPKVAMDYEVEEDTIYGVDFDSAIQQALGRSDYREAVRLLYLQLFVRSPKVAMDYEVEEDTIYGVDFDSAIQQALGRSDYREAVRLLYLQTLKLLSDAGRIDWQLYKTPTQYLNECRLPAFRLLTNEFLRVRYGHFEASDSLIRQLKSLQAEIFVSRHSLASQEDAAGLAERRVP